MIINNDQNTILISLFISFREIHENVLFFRLSESELALEEEEDY